MDYKKLYERIQNGEKDIDIAIEAGHTVDALYKRFSDYGILRTKKRHAEEDWDEQYEAYKAGKTISNIAKDLVVRSSTVYNHFVARGYNIIARKKSGVDKEKIYQEHSEGMTTSELSRKYDRTVTYIRFVLRSVKNKHSEKSI